LKDRPIIYLYHRNWLWAYTPRLAGRAQRAGWPAAGHRLEDGDRPLAFDAPMAEFLLKRLATIVPTLVFVSMLIFGLQQLLPGDPAMILAGEDQDPNVIAYLRTKLHLNEPLPLRYCTGSAVCCRATSANRSAPSSRC
jgi:hypothetical protein